MVQAIIPVLGTFAAGSTGALIVGIVNTVLINVALGAMQFRDAAGDLWVVADD